MARLMVLLIEDFRVHPSGMLKDRARRLGRTEPNIANALRRLVRDGMLIRKGHGAYALAARRQASGFRRLRCQMKERPPPEGTGAAYWALAMTQSARTYITRRAHQQAHSRVRYSEWQGKNLCKKFISLTQLLPASTSALLVAESQMGKSFIAAAAAYSVASGVPFLGKFPVTKRGTVAYCAFERYDEIVTRSHALGSRFGLWDLPYANINCTGRLVTKDLAWIKAQITGAMSEMAKAGLVAEGARPDLVVIDTLAAASLGLDTNSAKDGGAIAAAIASLAAEFGCSTLTLAQPSKTGARASRLKPSGDDTVYNNAGLALQIKGRPGSKKGVLGFSKFSTGDDRLRLPFKLVPFGRSMLAELDLEAREGVVTLSDRRDAQKTAPKAAGKIAAEHRYQVVREYLERNPGASQNAIARETGVNKRYVNAIVRAIKNEGSKAA